MPQTKEQLLKRQKDEALRIKGIFHSFLEDCNPLVAYYETVQHILMNKNPFQVRASLEALQEEYEWSKKLKEE